MIGKQDTYFVRHHSDSPYKYSEADINMLGFLVDNIYVVFGDQVFQQTVGIPVGTNLLLYWQTYSYIHMRQNLFRNCYGIITTKKLAVSFNHTFRYIDVLSINDHNFHNYVHLM